MKRLVLAAMAGLLVSTVQPAAVGDRDDLLDEYFPFEKVESLVVTRKGDVWPALANDGGESEPRIVRIR